jgi:hypothetical protein
MHCQPLFLVKKQAVRLQFSQVAQAQKKNQLAGR